MVVLHPRINHYFSPKVFIFPLKLYSIMSKFDDLIAKYEAEVKKLGLDVDTKLLTAVAKSLGPSIYNADAETIASSDPAELERVKKNFLIRKLGLADGEALDDAIQKTIEKVGSSNRNKYRVIFYALLAKAFKKEDVFG